MSDEKAAKIANARKKLIDHQNKKAGEKLVSINNVKDLLHSDTNNGIVKDNNFEVESKKQEKEIQNYEKNVTEILLQEKRTLEFNLTQLSQMFANLKTQHDEIVKKYQEAQSKSLHLETQLKEVLEKEKIMFDELQYERSQVASLKQKEFFYNERNADLEDKFELSLKKITDLQKDNDNLKIETEKMQNQLEFHQLHLHQITSDGLNPTSPLSDSKDTSKLAMNSLDEIVKLEKIVKDLENEKSQLSQHYQQYVDQMNEQLKALQITNDNLTKDKDELVSREQGLIEHMQEVEKQLQACYTKEVIYKEANMQIQTVDAFTETETSNEELELEAKIAEKETEIKKLQEILEVKDVRLIECQEAIDTLENGEKDIQKFLSANESDKVAAQRATAQNNKLKNELQDLQDAFVKMSQEKLILTEKLDAEKYLNRELTIKLADVEEYYKDIAVKLKSKDDEMIRLQSLCSQLQEQLNQNLLEDKTQCSHEHTDDAEVKTTNLENNNENCLHKHLQNEDVVLKLENRFTKLMKEVAELSDEKQKLEHLCSQLQSETETIGEYIALYQQQRGVLKQREVERDAQMKYLSTERDNLKKQLGYLKEISNAIEKTHTRTEINNVIQQIEQNHLIEPNKNCAMEKFHPCPWCSGKLIDV